MPNADRAAVAREAMLQLVNEFTDGTICDPFRLTPAQRARMLGYIDSEYAATSPAPPPIPLGAVVEVEGRVWTRTEDGWDDGHEFEYATWPVGRTLTALYHARRERSDATQRALDLSVALQVAEAERDAAQREREEARNDAAAQMMANVALANRGDDAIRERDAAQRELAARDESTIAWSGDGSLDDPSDGYTYTADAVRPFILHAKASAERQSGARLNDSVVSENAPLSGAGNMADSGNQAPAPASAPCGHTNTSPSPDSPHARVAAPRRWWLRRRSDAGWPDAHAYLSEEMARSARYGPTGGGWSDVVPVIEARVTRETVERVAAAMWDRSEPPGERWLEATHADEARNVYRSMARAALRALGLTVEE